MEATQSGMQKRGPPPQSAEPHKRQKCERDLREDTIALKVAWMRHCLGVEKTHRGILNAELGGLKHDLYVNERMRAIENKLRSGEEDAREHLAQQLAEKQLAEKQKQLARTAQENTTLCEEMRKLNARNARLSGMICSLEVEADDMLAIICDGEDSARLLQIANDTIARNKKKAAIFIADIKKKNADIAKRNADIAEKNADIAGKKQLTTATAKNDLEEKLATATSIIAGLHQQLKSNNARNAGLSLANATLTRTLASKLVV